jgi:hypothetical protein
MLRLPEEPGGLSIQRRDERRPAVGRYQASWAKLREINGLHVSLGTVGIGHANLGFGLNLK